MGDGDDLAASTFAQLFSLGGGPAAPTEAEPALRLPVLRDALTAADSKRRILALNACRSAMLRYGSPRFIGPEHQGLRPTANLWTPKTPDESFGAQTAVWNLLAESSRSWPKEDRREANQVLVESAPRLLFHQHADEVVLAILEIIADDPATNLQALVDRIVWCCGEWKENVSGAARARLAALDARIAGTTLISRLRRAILFATFDEQLEASKQPDEWNQKVGALAQEALDRPELLESVLRELTKPGWAVWAFGYHLAVRDTSRALIRPMIDAHRDAGASGSTDLLGGYFRRLSETDNAAREQLIRDLLADPSTSALAADLARLFGLTKALLQELLDAYDTGGIAFSHFQSLIFACAPVDMDEQQVLGLLKRWNALPSEKSAEFPLGLVDWYYCRGGNPAPLPERSVLQMLENDFVYDGPRIHGHDWSTIVKKFLHEYPARTCDVLRIIVRQVSRETSGLSLDAYIKDVSATIISSDPKASWAVISAGLADRRSQEAIAIWHWLRESLPGQRPTAGLLSLFPMEILLEWIAEAPHARASWVAGSVAESFEPQARGLARNCSFCTATERTCRMRCTIGSVLAGGQHP